MNYVLVFENKYTKKMNYVFEDGNDVSVTTDENKAKKFDNHAEVIQWYTENYYRLKSRSNIYGWKKQIGVNVDKPLIIINIKEEN